MHILNQNPIPNNKLLLPTQFHYLFYKIVVEAIVVAAIIIPPIIIENIKEQEHLETTNNTGLGSPTHKRFDVTTHEDWTDKVLKELAATSTGWHVWWWW